MASLLYVAPDAKAHLPGLRALLPPTGGASLIGDDVVFLRILARDRFDLRTALIPVLNLLTANCLPRNMPA